MTTTQSPGLTVSLSGESDVVMTRVFNAPRRLVFRAPRAPGRYTLVVGAAGHRDQALLVVAKR